jgi:integrase
MRAPPMPVEVLLALAWYFIRMGHFGGAVLLLIGFDCFLRTGEMLSLVISDVVLDESGSGVVRLAHTKTGQRHAAFEASTINDPVCGKLFRAYQARLPPSTHEEHYVFAPKAHVFYKLFHDGLRWLGLEAFGFLPYSIRRGGATAYFRATRNMEAALDRGRWSSARVARIYLNDGLAREVELRFGEETKAALRVKAQALKKWLETA